MLTIKYHAAFRRDYKRAIRRGCDPQLLARIVSILAEEKPLPDEYRDHPLSGNYAGCRECHITPDWLLIYEINKGQLTLYLLRTGSHSDLF